MTTRTTSTSTNDFISEVASREYSLDMKRVVSIILGGGQGSRLYPLTMSRCKPAMSFGGRYKLIDIPISNALNSGCQKIFIITQFLSSSLHQHIFASYRSGSTGSIELLTVEEKYKDKSWFEGTADAVRKNLEYFIDTSAEYFLILSGDQLYNMDFRDLLRFARKTDADAVVATLPVTEKEAKRMGVMQIDSTNRITSFFEKPQMKADLDKMCINVESSCPCANERFLGSMGIYLFKRKVLIDFLKKDSRDDFGKHVIPSLVQEGRAAAYIHHGYWEDIGTIESFHQANIALTHSQPIFNYYNEEWPLYGHHTTLPGARFFNTRINSSIICEGSIIGEGEVSHSILGPRTFVHEGTIIRRSYLMGNDFFTPQIETERLPNKFQIGKNCLIEKAIIDKHVCIGNNVQLTNKNNLSHYDSDIAYIRDGIIVVPRGAKIPDGFVL